jgi:hypothetical protein
MLGVNHQVSFGEFREIDGRPRGTLALAPKMKPTQTLAGGTPEQLRVGEQGEFARRKTKPTRHGADPYFGKIPTPRKGGTSKFAETFPLSLRGAQQDDFPSLLIP